MAVYVLEAFRAGLEPHRACGVDADQGHGRVACGFRAARCVGHSAHLGYPRRKEAPCRFLLCLQQTSSPSMAGNLRGDSGRGWPVCPERYTEIRSILFAATGAGLAEKQSISFDPESGPDLEIEMESEGMIEGTLRYAPSRAPAADVAILAIPSGNYQEKQTGNTSSFVTRTDNAGRL